MKKTKFAGVSPRNESVTERQDAQRIYVLHDATTPKTYKELACECRRRKRSQQAAVRGATQRRT